MVLFVCFVATLSDFGLLFLLIEVVHRAEKDAYKETIIRCTVLRIAQPLRYPDSADCFSLLDLQRCNRPNF